MADDFNDIAVDLVKGGLLAAAGASMAVIKTGRNVATTAKMLAPRESGETADSIDVFAAETDRPAFPGDFDVEVGPTTWYAHFLEDGTATRSPHAFMGPALDRHGHELAVEMERIAGSTMLGRFR